MIDNENKQINSLCCVPTLTLRTDAEETVIDRVADAVGGPTGDAGVVVALRKLLEREACWKFAGLGLIFG